MSKIKLYASTFHNVQFIDLDINLIKYKKAKVDDDFWLHLQQKVQKFGLKSIPNSDKIINAHKHDCDIITNIVNKYSTKKEQINLLSIGTGFGTTENELLQKHNYDVTAVEFGRNPNWDSRIQHVSNINQLSNTKKYDVVIIISVLFAFEDNEIRKLADGLSPLMHQDSVLIISEQSMPSIYQLLRNHLAKIAKTVLYKKKVAGEVLWGYIRSSDEITRLLSNHFLAKGSQDYKNDERWVKQEVQKPFTLFGFPVLSYKKESECYFTWYQLKNKKTQI